MPETSSASPQYGITPDTGAYRTSLDSPGFLNDTEIAELEYEPCEMVTGAIQTKGTSSLMRPMMDFLGKATALPSIVLQAKSHWMKGLKSIGILIASLRTVYRQKIHGSQKRVV